MEHRPAVCILLCVQVWRLVDLSIRGTGGAPVRWLVIVPAIYYSTHEG
jgi:hypothetical protein